MKSYVKLLIMILAFGGCKAGKLKTEELNRNDFCQIANQLIYRLQKDEKLKSHFRIENESVKIYFDTLIQAGNPFFFNMEVAERRARERQISIDEAYSEIQIESINNQNSRYKTNCFTNQIDRDRAEIQVKFWYSKRDNLISLDAVNILEEPGYLIGYLYLVEIDEQGGIRIIKEASWME